MDVIASVQKCLSSWSQGGEAECRNLLISPHCNSSAKSSIDILTTAYTTLLTSVLKTWPPKHPLALAAFLNFLQNVANSIPSSSGSNSSSNSAALEAVLVDVIWSIDAHLEEVLGDLKGLTSGESSLGATSKDTLLNAANANKAKQNAEHDKETVTTIVKRLLSIGILSAATCRERLDLVLLANSGLVLDKQVFDKKEIRTRTSLFYKQNKFNLLREQSEGYSKLIVELTSGLGPAHSPSTGLPAESQTVTESRARILWEKVISLVGYFDLDPNRALDIILDVLSTHLAIHHSFLVSLLSFSPWAATNRRPKDKAMALDRPVGRFKGKSLDEVLRLAESDTVEATGQPIAAEGPKVLAQVLGFKLSYYQLPNIEEPTPKSLLLTAAVLIREGFISLEDLYPHLSPSDEEMAQLQTDYLANVKSRIAAAKMSQLAMAAPLESGSSQPRPKPSPTPAEPKKPVENKEPNQKTGLVIALLAVGALRESVALLTRFPYLVNAHPEIADLMIRVMKASISQLYDSTLVPQERNASFLVAKPRFSASNVGSSPLPAPQRRPQLSLWAPTPPGSGTTDFVFFYPEWVDRVPVCSTLDDLEDVVEPLMRFVGLHISRDPLFLTKFSRLGKAQLNSIVPTDGEVKQSTSESEPEHPVRKFWFKMLRQYLLPALSLVRGNAVCTVEVWNIIRYYETTTRWALYGEWKTRTYKSHPELTVRQVQVDRESKGILRRLSHNTTDSLAGPVAKLAHSNPCIFFVNAVNQIMAYDNLAGVVIQALRYVTNMGFEVLVFIILDALSNPNKERVKDDGVNTTDWLQSLASFIGMLFRRYSADLSPVLRYVVNQLQNGQTTEIIVLRELIWKMAGIEPLPSLSDSQILAMAGGPALRIEAVASSTRGARLDPGEALLKGPARLGKALLESGLALPLLVQVAQQRQTCVYNAPDAHLKSLASLYDATHGVLLQYLELLTCSSIASPAFASSTVISLSDYESKILPPLAELGEKYGICAPICMQIMRPVLQNSILAAAKAMQEQERAANEEAEKRLKAALTAKREPAASASQTASPAANVEGAESKTTPAAEVVPAAEDVVMEPESQQQMVPSSEQSPWLPELETLFDDVKKITPPQIIDTIGPGFYTTFWQLSTYDLTPPASKYDDEGQALRSLSRHEDSKYTAADRSSDRAKRLTAPAHRARRDRINAFIGTLAQEFKDQTASRQFTLKRIAREKLHWFAHTSKFTGLINSIIEHCIQPRSLLSPMDADFCAQIIKVIHTQGTPGFYTLMCYDKLLGDHVKVVVFSCSEYEARNYGRFLFGVLSDLWKWHQDEQSYIQDNRTKSGGKTVFHPGLQSKWITRSDPASEEVMPWLTLKQVFKKWHRKLCKCFVDCIEAGDFMHVYNAIVVLKEILPVFPLAAVHDQVGSAIDKAMQDFVDKEERGDLKILGRAYLASLKKREPQWAPITKLVPKPAVIPTKPAGTPTAPGSRNATNPASSSTQTPAANENRRPANAPPASTPSAPRAQLSTTNATTVNGTMTKTNADSVLRPEVVKRVRKSDEHVPVTNASMPNPDAMKVDSSDRPSLTAESRPIAPLPSRPFNHQVDARTDSPGPREPIRKDLAALREASRPSSPMSLSSNLTNSPRAPRGDQENAPRSDSQQNMPPPSVPSQTFSAQELRETAKQSIGSKTPTDKPEDKQSKGQSSRAPSPISRPRTRSPATRPVSREHSADGRNTNSQLDDQPRVEREFGDSDRADERYPERDSRIEPRDNLPIRRDSLTHNRNNRERFTRDGDRDKDNEREKDRGRDRHVDRGGDRDRERGERDRRERERGNRDRDRDRHRKEDRERDNRKDHEPLARGNTSGSSSAIQDDRMPRSEPSRHRNAQNGDDGLGKRRRPTDDDPERGSKRSSRNHREDRNRKADKDRDDRPRESERRRRDRDGSEPDTRNSSDKPGEKRVPEGPSSSKPLPPSTPSAPRAMASNEGLRGGKIDTSSGRDWKRSRDDPNDSPPSSAVSNTGSKLLQDTNSSQQNPVSLQSRIGEKVGGGGGSRSQAPVNSYRPDNNRRNDDRDGGRKRTLQEREREPDSMVSGVGGEPPAQMPKKPKIQIDRDRYKVPNNPSHGGLARRTLPIDPQAGDRGRPPRKD